MGNGDFCYKFADLAVNSPLPVSFMPSIFLIHSMKQIVINHFHILGNYIAGDHIDIHDNTSVNFYQGENTRETTAHETCVEDVTPVDTSFFCTQQFKPDIIEKNLRQAITLASSKADACRRIMALEPLGYVLLSNVTDERKAELVNPFAMPKYRLTGEDFKKARNSSHSFPGK